MRERAATIRSFAKINLDLRVLNKRPDGYHELRTVFQTISLADTIGIRVRSARQTHLEIEGNVEIPNNLILRAAQAVLDAACVTAAVTFTLHKKIPMGAGLGGGSSNAASVLLSLPVLIGARIPLGRLVDLGAALGSDVPFFLYGGTALGIGRGTELFPLPDVPARSGILIAPGVHVSTPEAYRDLGRPDCDSPLTTPPRGADTESFRSLVWSLAAGRQADDWKAFCTNDFETAVFQRHPALQSVKRKLGRLGASPALMTGSGSALFGLFDSRKQLEGAINAFSTYRAGGPQVLPMTLLTARRYRNLWRQQLIEHIQTEQLWPPFSRYSKQ